MNMANKNTGSKRNMAVGVGVGVAALAAAAAAAYFFYGKGGAKNRAKAKKWAADAQREVVKNLKRLKTVNQAAYNRTVDAVAKKYRALKDISPGELQAITREMKAHWRNVNKAVNAKTRRG